MQSKKSLASRLTELASLGTAILFVASAVPLPAHTQSQSKSASYTFTVVGRSDHRAVNLPTTDGGQNHCWSTTTSQAKGVGISVGDDLCAPWEQRAVDTEGIFAKVMLNKISFRLNGKSYSTSDPDTVKRARSLFDPLLSVEAQQSDLGTKQGTLGERQGQLGHQGSDRRVSVPDMSAEFEKIEADVKRLSSEGATQSDLGNLQSELGSLQRRIGDLQSVAGKASSESGNRQSVLADQQTRLGNQQIALGDKAQILAASIVDQLRTMLMQAIRSGAAKPE
jgi:hypothetical protein